MPPGIGYGSSAGPQSFVDDKMMQQAMQLAGQRAMAELSQSPRDRATQAAGLLRQFERVPLHSRSGPRGTTQLLGPRTPRPGNTAALAGLLGQALEPRGAHDMMAMLGAGTQREGMLGNLGLGQAELAEQIRSNQAREAMGGRQLELQERELPPPPPEELPPPAINLQDPGSVLMQRAIQESADPGLFSGANFSALGAMLPGGRSPTEAKSESILGDLSERVDAIKSQGQLTDDAKEALRRVLEHQMQRAPHLRESLAEMVAEDDKRARTLLDLLHPDRKRKSEPPKNRRRDQLELEMMTWGP